MIFSAMTMIPGLQFDGSAVTHSFLETEQVGTTIPKPAAAAPPADDMTDLFGTAESG